MRVGIGRGPDPREVSRRFAALLEDGVADSPATLIGAEHEYQVVDRVEPSSTVDFRTLVHGLGLGRRHLDPDDPYAYRLRLGNVVTCDEAEAEIALAPLAAGPGSAAWLAAVADRERSALETILPGWLTLRGHSTHVSVSVPTALGEPVGRLFAQAFGLDVVRLVDSRDRCGVWVRPRSERLEVCHDFVAGDRLVAVITFIAAATAACLRSVTDGGTTDLPPLVRIAARRPRERSGWNLARRAFRGDPFDEDGTAPLELVPDGSMTASTHLATAWRALRERARAFASNEELRCVDALASGPGYPPIDPPRAAGHTRTDVPEDHAPGSLAPAFGDALTARDRGGYEVAVVAVTWGFAVFLLLRDRSRLGRDRRAFACVPRRHLERFLRRLDSGALDPILRAYLSSRPAGRILDRREQALSPGLFDGIGPRRALLPLEPEVAQLEVARPGLTTVGAA